MRYLLYLLLPAFLAAQASSPVVRNPWLDTFTAAGLSVVGNANVGGNLNVTGSVTCGTGCNGAQVSSGATLPGSCSTPGNFFLLTTTNAMYSCNGSAWVPLITSPFHNTFAADALNIGGSSISTPSTISLITPTITGPTDMFSVRINNCPITLEYGNGSIPVLQGIVGCTKAPDNSTLGGVSTGVSFYSFGGGGTANTPAVAAFGFGAPGSASNVYIGGFNGATTNALNGTGTGLGVPLFTSELDVNTASSGTPPELAHALALVSAATQQPIAAFDAADCRISIGVSLPFNQCLESEPGAATEGIRLWPLDSTASNSASQPIVQVSRNSAGTFALGKFYLDPAGSYQFFTAGGNFVINPSDPIANTSSPELTFSSYSSTAALQQGGMFLDSFGNLNINTSAATFAQTLFLNGAGETEAQVNKHSFQMAARTADPGCTTTTQIGSFWIDSGTTPGTTLIKVCKSVSSAIGWSILTTTP